MFPLVSSSTVAPSSCIPPIPVSNVLSGSVPGINVIEVSEIIGVPVPLGCEPLSLSSISKFGSSSSKSSFELNGKVAVGRIPTE